MAYIDGFVAAVPTVNTQAYLDLAMETAGLFKKHGAQSVVECWGDDVPEGKLNSMHTAVMRKPDESIVFSWITWESKAARDAAWAKIMEDSTMPQDMPFDGKRMIFGGFETLLEA